MAFIRSLSLFIVVMLTSPTFAQTDEFESTLSRINPDEALQLRSLLAEPVPSGVLKSTLYDHFRVKRNAADRLGDIEARLLTHRESLRYFPGDSWITNDYAALLKQVGDYEGSLALQKELVATEKKAVNRLRFVLQLAATQFTVGEFEASARNLDLAIAEAKTLQAVSLSPQDQRSLLRSEDAIYRLTYRLSTLHGKTDDALNASLRSVEAAREALNLTKSLSKPGDALSSYQVRNALEALGYSMAARVYALSRARRFSEAEHAVKDFVRLSQQETLDPQLLAELYAVTADLRMKGREFTVAAQLYTKAAAALDSLGYGPLHPPRVSQSRNLIYAYVGMHKWMEALNELNRLDHLAAADSMAQRNIRFEFIRGYTYLGNSIRLDEAAKLFDSVLKSVQTTLPENHFQVVEAKGLLGTTLWRSGSVDRAKQAIPLLREAIRGYMLPDNMDAGLIGIHRDIRELVFSNYVEALFHTRGESPLEAMAYADWIRGGSVQSAISDAALRAALTSPELADVVRGEQDRRNEVEGLRKFLSGEVGGVNTTLPVVATKMRARIAELETERKKLQVTIKSIFPQYDSLVRPAAPTLVELENKLKSDEALLLLLPTEEATYLWAINREGRNSAIRAEITKAELSKLVQSIRKTLDLSESVGGPEAFNAAGSSELYQRLIAPLEASISDKQHLIVAAGGTLARLPFGVLLSRPTVVANAVSPWLIKRYAITSVPSLSAWVASRRFSEAESAPEPFAAWGDPLFSAWNENGVTGNSTRKVNITRTAKVVNLEEEEPRSAIRYSDIPALPETREELIAIAEALKADTNNDLYLGRAATKSSVMQGNLAGHLRNKRVLAFATHGLMAGDLPNLNQPALALAATGQETSNPLAALLTLEDVLTLKLNADWVVLSACNTAAADGKAEEALSGLAR